MPLQAIGFDLGETLIHFPGLPLSWQSCYEDALLTVAERCHTTCTPTALQEAESILLEYNTRVNPRLKEVHCDEIFSRILQTWQLPVEPHLHLTREAFFGFFQRQAIPYEDTVATLQELKARGLKIGVLTDVPYGMPTGYARRDLESTGVAALVDVVLTSLDVGLRKPAPQGYIALARCLDCPISDMLYVGNEPKDIQGARAAHMQAVFIQRAGLNWPEAECVKISTLQDLIALTAENC